MPTPGPYGFRFPLLFIAGFALLQLAYNAAPAWLVEDLLVHRLTVRPSVAVLDGLWPEFAVTADGSRLVSPAARINVLRGCEGTEALLMLLAAVLAAGLCGTARPGWLGAGLAGSALVVFALNQLRIVGLFLVAVRRPDWFAVAHGYLAPIVVVGGATLFFVAWLQAARPRAPAG